MTEVFHCINKYYKSSFLHGLVVIEASTWPQKENRTKIQQYIEHLTTLVC